jgi:uncharacterized membrane protein
MSGKGTIVKAFLNGILAALPLGLTVSLVVWLGVWAESNLGGLIRSVLPAPQYYWPGMGIAAGFVIVFILGLVMNLYIARRLIEWGESLVARIPFVKTLYAGLKDMMSFVAGSRSQQLNLVVRVTFNDSYHVIGFVTRQSFDDIRGLEAFEGLIAVYIPFSYQIGGYTVMMERSKVTPLAMPVEEAMRYVVMAGMSGEKGKTTKPDVG